MTDLSLIVTNVNYPNGESEWVVQNTNGISVSIEQSKVTVYFALDSSFTVRCDSKTRSITNVILEKPGGSGAPGEYIFDFNGDGTPDERRIKTADRNELFYRGKWYPFKPIGTNIVSIDVDGSPLRMAFDGAQWSMLTNNNEHNATSYFNHPKAAAIQDGTCRCERPGPTCYSFNAEPI